MAEGAFEEAVRYAQERQQFGQKIIGFQVIQHMIADMAMEIEATRALLYTFAKNYDAGVKNLGHYAAMVKAKASEVAVKVTDMALQIAGGYGYMKEYPFEKFYRDARITPIYEGTNQIQRNEIAAGVIKEFGRKK